MINLISTQARNSTIRGPHKVFSNLVKGLDRIGYPYVINRDLNATRRLWIHDDRMALRYAHRSEAFKVIGPNMASMPGDLPPNVRFGDDLLIQPCAWVVNQWQRAGFTACALGYWPVGIDTDEFKPSGTPMTDRHVMIYHKERDVRELEQILEAVTSLKLPYRLVLYGQYDEDEYQHLLQQTSFVIWHGRHETQGIALQQALACNVPVLVCDVTSFSQAKWSPYVYAASEYDVRVTSVPYWDDSCGKRIFGMHEVDRRIEEMLDRLLEFHPRDFILRELSLEKQAREFVGLWERWGLTFEAGLHETARSDRPWHEGTVDRVTRKARRFVNLELTWNRSTQ